ncbi:MAG: O-antigen ligase family protein [Candidatus Sericytochromatia bacterium]
MLRKFKLEASEFLKSCFLDFSTDILFYLGILLLLFWMPISSGARYLDIQTAGQVITGSLILLFFKQKNNFFYKYPLWSISFFWIGTLSLSLFFSSSKILSMEELLRNIMYISLPVIIFGWSDSENRRKLVSYSIITAGSLVSIIGLGYFLINYIKTQSFEAASMPLARSNDLGAYLLLIFPLAFSNFLYEEERYSDKFIYAFTALLSFITILATFSRGIWVSAIFAMILILTLGFRILKKNIISVSIIGILSFIPLILKWDLIVNRFLSLQNIFNSSENSIEWRKSLLKSCLNIFYDNPIIGTGLNTFSQVLPAYQEKPGYFSIDPHNYYLKLLAETGVIGFLAFIIFVLSILYMSFKAFTNSEKIFKGISLGLLVGIISSLIHISLDIDWSVSAIPMLFWIEVGILIAIYRAVGFKETRFANLSDRFDYIKKPIAFFIATLLLILPTLNYSASMLFTNSLKYIESDSERAKSYLNYAMNIIPFGSGKFANTYSEILMKEKNFVEALEYQKKAIKYDVYNTYYYKNYSDILMEIDPNLHKDMALDVLIKSINYAPFSNPNLYKNVADFYLKYTDKKWEAIKWLKLGAENFSILQLYNYERLTPDHRYQLYAIYKELGKLTLNDSPVTSQYYTNVAKFLIETEPDSEYTNKEYGRPSYLIKKYWADLKNGKDITHYYAENSNILPPPKELSFTFIDYIDIERKPFNSKIKYLVSVTNKEDKRDLIIEDRLILTSDGWKIFYRILGEKK